MKLTASGVEGFVKTGPSDQRVILFYGPDSGAIREYSQAVIERVVEDVSDPFRLDTVDASDLKDAPSSLVTLADTMSFSGGRRAVRVRGGTDSIVGALELVLDSAAGDGVVVIECGELAARSKIRVLCEKHDRAVAIACYPAEGSDRGALVREIVSGFGLRIDREALEAVVGLLGPDRALNRLEIEKLCFFKGVDGGEIGAADVEACLIDHGTANVDRVVLDAMLGQFEPTLIGLERLAADGMLGGGVLRQSGRLLDRMLEARRSVETGVSAGAAVDRLRPPVFFRIKPLVTRVVGTWPADLLVRASGVLLEGEKDSRGGGAIEADHIERAFLRLAQMGRRLTRS